MQYVRLLWSRAVAREGGTHPRHLHLLLLALFEFFLKAAHFVLRRTEQGRVRLWEPALRARLSDFRGAPNNWTEASFPLINHACVDRGQVGHQQSEAEDSIALP